MMGITKTETDNIYSKWTTLNARADICVRQSLVINAPHISRGIKPDGLATALATQPITDGE